jgi:hypothetical protein
MELEPINREVQQYVSLKNEIDQLTDRRDVIKKRLLVHVEQNGEPNEKGSLVFEINDETSNTKSVIKQRRVSKVFNQAVAEEILKAKGVYDVCTKTVVTLDEDAVMGAYYNGDLTDDDIDTMFPEKIIWALVLEKAD